MLERVWMGFPHSKNALLMQRRRKRIGPRIKSLLTGMFSFFVA